MTQMKALEDVSYSTKVLVSGMLGGIFAAIFSQPCDTIKTVMQAHLDVYKNQEYRSFWTTASYLRQTHGIQYLWRGILPRGLRLICASVIINATRVVLIDVLEKRQEAYQGVQ
eukprot:TRINITY_DN3969_c0_g1_i2.p4 TRINITY_DN3969_c0_g1~~TRINITY_DN3969_c0_g1_i2.p4  ORF type:complete len:113 (-),score=4.51 TRINITY_DN3969_c0_g1_i2:539-877(-)